MYEAFYKLTDDPFRLLPDPDVCFPHQSCAKAWAYLRYALKRGEGIVVVTGPPGSGKTTLGERLINELDASKTVSVRVVASDLNITELLRRLAYAFGIAAESMDRAMLTHRIESYLTDLERKNRSALVLIDEAQTMSDRTLEALRLLSDLQSPRSRPLLQLFLMGQEELEGVISAPDMEQFQQRVIASCRLRKMGLAETKAYMEYRLDRVNWSGDPSINGQAVQAVFRHSHGLPRHVNKICSRLLLYGCTEEKHQLAESDVLAVVRDLRDELLAPKDDEPQRQLQGSLGAFDSVHELALEPAVNTAPSAPVARPRPPTLHLSKETSVAAPPTRPVVQQAQPTAAHRPPPYERRRKRVRSLQRHLLRSILRRAQYLLQWFKQRWVWIRRVAPLAGAASIALGRQMGANIVRTLRRAKSSIPGLRRRLNALLEKRPLPRRPVLMALAVVGLLLGGILLWGIQDDGQIAVGGRLVESGGQSLPPELERATLIANASILSESADYLKVVPPKPSDDWLARLTSPDSRALYDIENRIPGVQNPALQQTLSVGQDPALRWFLSAVGGGLGQRLRGNMAGDLADFLLESVASDDNNLQMWPLAQTEGEKRQGTEVAEAWNAVKVRVPGVVSDQPTGGAPGSPVEASVQMAAGASGGGSGASDFTRLLPSTGAGGSLSNQHFDTSYPQAGAHQGRDIPSVVAAPETATAVETESAAEPDTQLVSLLNTPVQVPDKADAVSVQQTRIVRLLRQADTAIAGNRLLIPEDASAYTYLKQVLAIDAGNKLALARLQKIVRRYDDMARKALRNGAHQRARRFIGRALRVDRNNKQVLALRAELDAAVARKKEEALAAAKSARMAELARMAAKAREPEPVVEEPPRRSSGSSFDRIMRLMDGI